MPVDFEISPLITPPPANPVPVVPSTPVAPVATPPAVEPPTPEPPSIPPPMKRSSNSFLKLFIIIAALLVVVTVATLWWGGSSFSDAGVTVSIQAADRAVSGDQIVYKVMWHNGTGTALNDLSFRIFYPPGAIVLDSAGKPTNPDSEGFAVDTLGAGQSGDKDLPVFLVGDKGAIKTAKIQLTYNAGTIRSSFQKEASVATTITDLPVTLTLVALPTATSGSPVQYTLDMTNNTGTDLSDLKLQFTYPDGFILQTSQPKADIGGNTYTIASLKARQVKQIIIGGTLSGNEQETKTVTAALQHNLNGQYVDYVRTDAFTMISSPLLSVTIAPKDGPDYISFAGDILRYTVHYQNNSKYTFLGVILGVKLEGSMLDLTQLRVDNGTFDQATNAVIFDSSGIPNFASLPPGTAGTVTFSVPVKTTFPSGGGTSSFFVKATANMATANIPAGLDQASVAAVNSVVTKISTQPTLQSAIQYDNGAGSGPMPAKVGNTTTLTVHWSIINPGNDIKNGKVTALLPPGVTWVGNGTTSNGGTAPTFNKSSSTVVWNVGTVQFGTGTGAPRIEGTFQISITPSSNQVGTVAQLVSQQSLSGTDAYTNQPVQVGTRDYTTDSVENHTRDGRIVAQ